MHTIAKLKSYMNVIWAKKIHNREGFAFPNGFPATFFLTSRRAIVVGEFLEKQGWFRKKIRHRLIFEAGLHKLKDWDIKLIPAKKIFTGFLSFHAHHDLGEGAMIQFKNMDPRVGKAIEKYLTDLKIVNPPKKTGVVLIDEFAPEPQKWLNRKFGS